jgi:WD40 repeat protein
VIVQFTGHTGTIYAVACSNDGRLVASGSGDNTLRIWDINTGQETVAPVKHKGDVLSVSCSPTEPIVVTASTNKLHMIDLNTGEVVGQADHSHNVYEVEFSPDGRNVASGGNDNRAYFYEAKSGKLLGSGEWQAGDISAIAYNPSGSPVAIGSADRRLKTYDSETRRRIIETRAEANITSLAFSADGTRLLSSDIDGGLRVWNPSTVECTSVIERDRRLHAIATSPTDTLVAVAGYSDEVEVWDYQTGSEFARFPGFAGETLAVAFDPSGSKVVAGGTDDVVTVLDLR